jgi:hypothetical protein
MAHENKSVSEPNRDEFLRCHATTLESLLVIGIDRQVSLRQLGETCEFEYDLWDFLWDPQCFNRIVEFISASGVPSLVFFAEVETVEGYTESVATELTASALQAALSGTALPHYRTVCFSSASNWALLFDPVLEKTTATRRK